MVNTTPAKSKKIRQYSKGYMRGLVAGYTAKRAKQENPAYLNMRIHMHRNNYVMFGSTCNKVLVARFKRMAKKQGMYVREALDQALTMWVNS